MKAKQAMASEPPTLGDFPEVESPAVSEVEPARATFVQTDDLPDEPKSDVQITLETGEVFRERITSVPLVASGNGLPDGLNLSFSLAKMTADGSVATDESGRFMIVPPESRAELRLQGEDMATMGEAGVTAAITQYREIAAAKARDYFAGMEIGNKVLSDRLI